MMLCTQENLLKFLDHLNLKGAVQKETNQVYVIFTIEKQEFPLFFRIYEEGDLLQLLIFFPLQVRPERYAVMARMLHLLNKEVDLPGFGIDESVGLVFHRIMIPVYDKKIDSRLLESYVEATPKICEQFYPTIAGTSMSEMSFEEIMKKSQNSRKTK